MSVEHWDELPVDDLRTRIAELEQWRWDAAPLLVEFRAMLAFSFSPTTATRANLIACVDALLPKEVASGT